ncbi:MAG: HD domain-containing protein [Deltaproteobacteria bacterium]|nr:HD domain-containing protein [Deltaproteobacteria bacterium]
MPDAPNLREVTRDLIERDGYLLSPFATPHKAARRARGERTVLRSEFARDRDRIIYSDAYKRYAGKTQVVFLAARFDEHISTRLLHTTYVSQVSRSIAKALKLNVDLVEAIAVGHDLGHPPFGHDGESVLNELCIANGLGPFKHNVNSLYVVDRIANRSKGLNLTVQVRDGILCHDGESSLYRLAPAPRLIPPERVYEESGVFKNVNRPPATMEGCVVRAADSIAYLGQDLEDAIRLGVVKRSQIPGGIVRRLGDRGKDIVNSLIIDLVSQSLGKKEIGFSKDKEKALLDLKAFNYHHIYYNRQIKKGVRRIRAAMTTVFNELLEEKEKGGRKSLLYRHFLKNRSGWYKEHTLAAAQVRDFVASMTDHYMVELLKNITIPQERNLPLTENPD